MVERVGGVGGLGPIRDIGEKQKKVEKSNRKVQKEGLSSSVKEEVGKVMKEAQQVPDVRRELVEEIKKAIESGNYIIDAENIAKKLLGGG